MQDQTTTTRGDSVLIVACVREWTDRNGNTYNTMRVVFPDSHNVVLSKEYGHGYATAVDRAKCAYINYKWDQIDPATATLEEITAHKTRIENDLSHRIVVLVDSVRVTSRKQLHTEGEWL